MDEECPICLANMHEEDGLLLLECCNKYVHLGCIMDWCKCRKTPAINCILCNQYNNFLIETSNRVIELFPHGGEVQDNTQTELKKCCLCFVGIMIICSSLIVLSCE